NDCRENDSAGDQGEKDASEHHREAAEAAEARVIGLG
ncbi:MAG: hypothetical protein QOF73_2665, partial [Thermomicrobiales bacterium]|nr:hypothetical protein [Thermomicrobiales bacterium]